MSRREDRCKSADKIPKREYDQSGGDRLCTDYISSLSDTASNYTCRAADLVRGALGVASD